MSESREHASAVGCYEKPEDNPCKTCASVTCARIWKLDCVRTNIYKELEVYSSNLFASIASKHIQSATGSLAMNPQRRILKLSFKGQSPSDIKLQVMLAGGRVIESNEELSKKLLQFLRASATVLYSIEGSSIIRKSLLLAYELANKNEDRLLFQVLELWRLTNTICRKDFWHLSFETLSEEDKPQQLNGSESPHFANMAYAQIRAAAEMHASSLSKNIMIDLEKRLGRKERCQGFETFLIGVTLLNCVERMVWSLKAYSNGSEMTEVVSSMKSIDLYVEQAESFSEFISKLFGMRGIVLRVRTNHENGVLQAIATNAPIAKGWLSSIELTSMFCFT
ncbi:MAG: hypothetical protein Q9167_006102 [Letrouitia subvulpina]